MDNYNENINEVTEESVNVTASQTENTVNQDYTEHVQPEPVQPEHTQQATAEQPVEQQTTQQSAYQGDYTYQWQSSQWQSQQPNQSYVVYEQPTQKKQKKQKVKKEKSSRTPWGAMVALALCCAILGGGVGSAVTTALVSSDNSIVSTSSSSNGSTTSGTIINTSSHSNEVVLNEVEEGEEMTAAEVYANNVNATVGITTSITTNYFGYTTTSAASGSGFIISSDGYILTNYHVVEDSSSITVSLYNDESYSATLVGYDESNDIAVLKIEAEGLSTVTLGDSDALNVGDSVVAIGNPLGELTFSLTAGVVSALNRSVTLSTGTTMELIQTDCAINSGNSGGALFNMYGEVVGITNAKYSSSSSSEASIDNIGFAIPINTVKDIVYSIIETGTYEKSYIGVTVTDVTTSTYYSTGITSGAVVYSVTEGAPADEAGLEVGDIITKADDTEITGASSLSSYVGSLNVGDELVLEVYRDGETRVIVVTVGSTTQSALPDSSTTESETDTDTDSDSQSGSQSGGQSDGSSSWSDMFGDMFGNFGFGGGSSSGSDSGSGSGSGSGGRV
ncbi:MAG: trypsin-like peptidase domain-containing protein [Oscillospiraceae bacterium]|nr:trypsin-like peptidase domain-containing protein [Oscillospiraceae bacterium]